VARYNQEIAPDSEGGKKRKLKKSLPKENPRHRKEELLVYRKEQPEPSDRDGSRKGIRLFLEQSRNVGRKKTLAKERLERKNTFLRLSLPKNGNCSEEKQTLENEEPGL